MINCTAPKKLASQWVTRIKINSESLLSKFLSNHSKKLEPTILSTENREADSLMGQSNSQLLRICSKMVWKENLSVLYDLIKLKKWKRCKWNVRPARAENRTVMFSSPSSSLNLFAFRAFDLVQLSRSKSNSKGDVWREWVYICKTVIES